MRIINTLKGMLFTVIALIALTNVSNAVSIKGVYVEDGSSAILDGHPMKKKFSQQ